MDFACRFQESNLFRGEIAIYRTSDPFNSQVKFKCRGIGCNFLGQPRLNMKAYQKKKLKNIVMSSTNRSIHSSILVKGEFDSRFWGYNSCRSFISDFVSVFKTTKEVVRLRCQGNDSTAHVDGNGVNVEFVESYEEEVNMRPESNGSVEEVGDGKDEGPTLDELRELLQKAIKELEVAGVDSTKFEEKAYRISEAAIALKDEAAYAWDNVSSTLNTIQEILNDETVANEAVQKATMALSMAEVRLHEAAYSLEAAKGRNASLDASRESDLEYESGGEATNILRKEEENLLVAEDNAHYCRATLANCEVELRQLQSKKEELQKEVDRLSEVAKKAQMNAMKTEEDVANVMLLAEQAVAFELEAAQRVNDAEIALQRAEQDLSVSQVDSAETTVNQNGSSSHGQVLDEEGLVEDKKMSQGNSNDTVVQIEGASLITEPFTGIQFDGPGQSFEEPSLSYDSEKDNGKLGLETSKDNLIDSEKSKNMNQTIKQESLKDLTRDSSPFNAPKALLKKSSRFFSASFFSLDGSEFTPASLFHGLVQSARKQLPKLVVGSLLIGAGIAFYVNQAERMSQLFLQPDIITTSVEEVSTNAKPLVQQIRRLPKRIKKLMEKLPHQEVNEEEASLFDMLWLLLASVIFVPMFQKIPGGKQLPKLVVGSLLIGAGIAFYVNQAERMSQLFLQPDIITTSVEEVSTNAKPLVQQIRRLPKRIKKLMEKLPHQEVNEEEASLFDMLWLLLASVIFVPMFQKIPGGSPVLGYLAAGILIGPYGLSIIRHVHGTKAIAEFGVVFLLFNIGLELSVERLNSMKKYVFGLGSAQVLVTAVVVGVVARFIAGQPGPAALVIGNGLALSSTAVVLQVLQERGESTSRHGRATFSVLLFQDLAVVVLLILIPLISPKSSKGGVGFQAIAEALGLAGVKAVVAITAIVAGGRLLLRPIYKQVAENQNAEIFSANTLLVILGTSLLTARAGLSMALGAFLAGLLLAETEFSLQVESDIAPYRGLLLGLFFMTVGMSIDPKLLVSNFPVIIGTLALLIGGKTILVAVVGRFFGISIVSAIRVGLLLAPGGEFAFVAFGEAVNQGILSSQLSSLLFLLVGISMALTPWLAAGGQLIASRFEQHDVRSLLPVESETDDLQDHIIICGFGRAGQIIAQLLSERLIPFVALDVRSDRVAVGRALELPIYFGDAGSREVLHKVGAERACAAAITLDTPGANYRAVWALSKYFPNVKTFVRAHDVDHGLNLEKAGATAVVPETLEPSLQLAAAVLAQAKLPMSEIAATINEFRSRHLSELTELSEANGSSLGYGYLRIMSKPKSQPSDSSDASQIPEGTLAI
ncbi:K(+) efflux antiporter 2 like [Actinidia chinensis var. chinensis]|uniref:K(+) efflux antiporter 2 like n=1 Tax=Actinidia chinensis var. chinensis TaxID=1590841 RepID=A0A2R6Q8V3_ACTCC|nr:K(+) efflux antiporter 2 like [Actinidia chinensis var. chinensis]